MFLCTLYFCAPTSIYFSIPFKRPPLPVATLLTFFVRLRRVEKCREKSSNVKKCQETSSSENFWWSVEKSREMLRNIIEFWKFLMACLMEVLWGVLGWVQVFGLEVFGAGWSRFGMVPIVDFDITRRYATCREMPIEKYILGDLSNGF